MKNMLKRLLPYVMINSIIYAILGAIIGKNLDKIHNTSKRIDDDSKALERIIKEMGGRATHIKIEDIDESEVPEDIRKKADPKDPLDPTVIYVHN